MLPLLNLCSQIFISKLRMYNDNKKFYFNNSNIVFKLFYYDKLKSNMHTYLIFIKIFVIINVIQDLNTL